MIIAHQCEVKPRNQTKAENEDEFPELRGALRFRPLSSLGKDRFPFPFLPYIDMIWLRWNTAGAYDERTIFVVKYLSISLINVTV